MGDSAIVQQLAVAFAAGVALGPVLIVFPPMYFPWTLLVSCSAGLLTGLVGDARGTPRHRVTRTAAGVVLLFAASLLVVARGWMGSFSPALFAAFWWLLVPIAGGALLGAVARGRLGLGPALAASIGGVAALAVVGMALAFAAAPSEVANPPVCEQGRECARARCWMVAERIRLLAVERVTTYGGDAITCVYTAWGGLHVGTAVSSGRGSTWDEGRWPQLLRTWRL